MKQKRTAIIGLVSTVAFTLMCMVMVFGIVFNLPNVIFQSSSSFASLLAVITFGFFTVLGSDATLAFIDFLCHYEKYATEK